MSRLSPYCVLGTVLSSVGYKDPVGQRQGEVDCLSLESSRSRSGPRQLMWEVIPGDGGGEVRKAARVVRGQPETRASSRGELWQPAKNPGLQACPSSPVGPV